MFSAARWSYLVVVASNSCNLVLLVLELLLLYLIGPDDPLVGLHSRDFDFLWGKWWLVKSVREKNSIHSVDQKHMCHF
ncbi:hypothetical protein BC941DRAFT_426219 [Chlamydoabsidia padenii]|nr:hypothetical protein BC941DRAFT_426219 [Chlamydoabsidia padenii]